LLLDGQTFIADLFVSKLKTFLLLALLSFSAFAQGPRATNFTGEKQELREVFDQLWGNFKDFDNSHCYRRAHVLSYQMTKMNITSEKVFVFFGKELELSKHWWYHVAPLVYYRGEGVVLDKGLFKGATFLSDWIFSFGEGKKCEEIFSMDEYRSKIKTSYCLYLVAPMHYYSPASLESLDLQKFEKDDLYDMIFSLGISARKKYLSKYPIE
jgi:hypothetical protein